MVADDQVAVTFWHGIRPGRFLPVEAKLNDPRKLPSWYGQPVVTGRPAVFAADGWYDLEANETGCWRWSAGQATNLVWWDGPVSVSTEIRFTTKGCKGSKLSLLSADTPVWQTALFPSASKTHRLRVTLHPGSNSLQWRLDGPTFQPGGADTRVLGFKVENLSVSVR